MDGLAVFLLGMFFSMQKRDTMAERGSGDAAPAAFSTGGLKVCAFMATYLDQDTFVLLFSLLFSSCFATSSWASFFFCFLTFAFYLISMRVISVALFLIFFF